MWQVILGSIFIGIDTCVFVTTSTSMIANTDSKELRKKKLHSYLNLLTLAIVLEGLSIIGIEMYLK